MRINRSKLIESMFSRRGLQNLIAAAALTAPVAGAVTGALVPPPSVQAVPPPSVHAASIPDGSINPASSYTYY
ncbi:hypothetical protein [Catenuloplanes atrovinosus]|uniref:Uncharacterized protein n=1 Tax=Catenuloplanes atrovinosus TaxID=137266 RepID=A0AAE4CB33_9ACTN|nr:hypothetical protein [Catenuloplanes atrovinosus]MDR7277678.1 hypothetical protein [Catenuloplanes atrovinosus]